MRYLRTKDGRVFDTKDNYEFEDGWLKVKGNTLIETTCEETVYEGEYVENKTTVNKIKIIKQADTIEELCDRFVLAGIDIIILNKEHTQYRFEGEDPYVDYEWFDITETELKRGIRGAIWTDKGLTYVTKPMTKKGKFEVL